MNTMLDLFCAGAVFGAGFVLGGITAYVVWDMASTLGARLLIKAYLRLKRR
jgi:hypothetical protein